LFADPAFFAGDSNVIKDIMPSFPANISPRVVVVTTYTGVMLLDVAGPVQVFEGAAALAEAENGVRAYEIVAASRAGGLVATDVGIPIQTLAWAQISSRPVDTVLVPGGPGAWEAAADSAFVGQVAAFSRLARRTASVCLGAFVLAAAGLLDGRRAVTHWRHCAALRAKHPEILVEGDPIFVRDGEIWTSAGVSAGIDLALAMVEADLGHAMAVRVAQSLVVFLKRPGGQAQFSVALSAQTSDRDGMFTELLAWMRENLAADLRVEALAARARMSPRTFARAYLARTGMTPAKAVEAMRVETARQMLQTEWDTGIAAIARRCGFEDDERLRRAFVRLLGVSPTDYRIRFGRGSVQA